MPWSTAAATCCARYRGLGFSFDVPQRLNDREACRAQRRHQPAREHQHDGDGRAEDERRRGDVESRQEARRVEVGRLIEQIGAAETQKRSGLRTYAWLL